MYYNNKNKKNSHKKRLVSVAVIAILVLAGIVTYWLTNHSRDSSNDPGNTSDINYSPPTQQERESAEAHKEKVEDQMEREQSSNQPTSNNQSTRKEVTPIITIAEQNPETRTVEINGYVTGVYEAGGTCTVTLTKGSGVIKQSRPALKDAQTTTCGLSEIPRSKLTAGGWTVILSYLSTTSKGISESQVVEVK